MIQQPIINPILANVTPTTHLPDIITYGYVSNNEYDQQLQPQSMHGYQSMVGRVISFNILCDRVFYGPSDRQLVVLLVAVPHCRVQPIIFGNR